MNTTPTRPTCTTPLPWQKWLIIFAVGILLPLFGVRVRAHAAAWSQLSDHGAVVAAPLEGDDDDGSDDHGGDNDSSDDDSSGDNDGSDDNGADDANDDHGGSDDNGGDNDGSDDNGADDANDDNDGSDDNGADDANDDNSGNNDSSDDDDDSRTSGGRRDRNRAAVQRTGVITSLPATGRQGAWMIDGVTYFVTRNTEMSLLPGMGAVTVGQCVKLHIVPGTTNIVREVDVETAEHCTTAM